MEGWIKLHRKFCKWEWFGKSQMVHLFIYLLLKANHDDKTWQNTVIKRGELVTGLHTLKADTGISIQSLRTCLKRLKSTNEITIKSTNKNSIITVCNYDSYQDAEINNNKLNNNLPNKQLTNNQQTTNNKQECKEGKEEERTVPPPSPKKPSIAERNFEYLPIAKELSRIIRETKNIEHTKQQIHHWTNDIRQLVEGNKVSVERINKGLQYLKLHAGEQYCPVIESGSALKEKFGKLEGQMNKTVYKEKNTHPRFYDDREIPYDWDENKQRYISPGGMVWTGQPLK